ncbi:tn3 transposase DDE domain protein (plasmid) [Bacillus cereus]|nr:tn3 transposase DDE domain protein [Bacillus cereus]
MIVRKLSSYARKNQTKRALWEYDNIIKSLYFLEYIDSLPLRQNVQKVLNRGESYHKLRRAVSFANFVSRLNKISKSGRNVVGF